jgi:DNA polymerase III subunit gamma/tau
LARHAALVNRSSNSDEQRVELQIAPKHEMVASAQSVAQLEAMLQQYFAGLRLSVVHTEPSYAIPIQVLAERKRARLAHAEQSLREDPIVKELMTVFDAELQSDSITPID